MFRNLKLVQRILNSNWCIEGLLCFVMLITSCYSFFFFRELQSVFFFQRLWQSVLDIKCIVNEKKEGERERVKWCVWYINFHELFFSSLGLGKSANWLMHQRERLVSMPQFKNSFFNDSFFFIFAMFAIPLKTYCVYRMCIFVAVLHHISRHSSLPVVQFKKKKRTWRVIFFKDRSNENPKQTVILLSFWWFYVFFRQFIARTLVSVTYIWPSTLVSNHTFNFYVFMPYLWPHFVFYSFRLKFSVQK